jgi:hypothetical protein
MTQARAKQVALEAPSLRRSNKLQGDIDNLVAIACADGNWNYSPYFMGMANGILVVKAALTGETPKFLSSPERWLEDLDTGPPPEGKCLLHQFLSSSVP